VVRHGTTPASSSSSSSSLSIPFFLLPHRFADIRPFVVSLACRAFPGEARRPSARPLARTMPFFFP